MMRCAGKNIHALNEQTGQGMPMRSLRDLAGPTAENVVEIIPARGGSKGLPNKNTRLLCGKPLVTYSIESALRCPRITHVVVSSDDEGILEIAASMPGCHPLRRPPELATDNANLSHVVDHALRHVAQTALSHVDFVTVFLPTHPFRPPRLIADLVAKGLAGHGTVRTVKRIVCRPDSHFTAENGRLRRLIRDTSPVSAYRPYGLFSGFRTDHQVMPYSPWALSSSNIRSAAVVKRTFCPACAAR